MKWLENLAVRVIDYGFSFWFGWVIVAVRSIKNCLFLRGKNFPSAFLSYLFLPFEVTRELTRMGSQYSKEDDKVGSYNCLGENKELVVNEQKNKSFDLDFNGNFKSRSHIHFGSRKKIKDSDVIAITWELAEKKIDASQLRGLTKGARVFWVKANIAESGYIKWIGRIKGILFAGLQLDNKVTVTLEGYSGKSLFTCKTRRGRALVLLSQVVPDKEFLCRDETRARNVAAVDFEASNKGIYSQNVPSPVKSTSSDSDNVQSRKSAAKNAYLQYNQLKPQSWDIGDRIYFSTKKCYATIIARGCNGNNQDFVIEYDERLGDPDLTPTPDLWFKEGHGRVMSMRKLIANAFIVEPNLNPSCSLAPSKNRHSAPPEYNNNRIEPFSSSVTTIIVNTQALQCPRKRNSENSFMSDNAMKKRAFSSLEYPPEFSNGRHHESISVPQHTHRENYSVKQQNEYDQGKFWGECSSKDLLPGTTDEILNWNNNVVQGRGRNFRSDTSENRPNYLKNTSLKSQSGYWGEGHKEFQSSHQGMLNAYTNFEQGLRKCPEAPPAHAKVMKQTRSLPRATYAPHHNNNSGNCDPLERRKHRTNSCRNIEIIV